MGLSEEQKKEWQEDFQRREIERLAEEAKTRKYQRVGIVAFLSFMYAKADPNFAPSWITLIAWGVCGLCVLYLFGLFVASMWKGE